MGLHHMTAWLKRTLRPWPRLMITATKEVETEGGGDHEFKACQGYRVNTGSNWAIK